MKKRSFFLSFLFLSLCLYASNAEKAQKIKSLRETLSRQKIARPILNTSTAEVWSLLDEDGRFTDFRDSENKIETGGYTQGTNMQQCIFINNVARDAFERLWIAAENYRGIADLNLEDERVKRLMKAIVFYGKLENERNDDAPGRFHASCFATPRAAVNIYFCLFGLMENIEAGGINDSIALNAHRKLLDVGFQSWKQPLRHDETDNNIVSVDRFRKHVWWVGGNALDYRPVFETALMMRSIPMIDVMAEVAKNSISVVSQTTYDSAFWNEGMTADGAGWGHGKQCLIWGYPIDGMKGSFRILNYLKNSPWAQKLSRENVEVLLTYVRNSSFYHFKGVTPPLVDRGNMVKRENYQSNIPAHTIARTLLNDWQSSLTPAEIEEMEKFIQQSAAFDVQMTEYPAGNYHGVRYFYNNDDIIKKTPDYYLFVNMASNRVDGLESAYPNAAGYNFYSADGVTLFQKNGVGYREIIGAMTLTAWPGVTTRQTTSELLPTENWRGFTSKHNFAAGAGNNNSSFAAGFIYEKINASHRDNSEFATLNDKNKDIYGVLAYKSYFMFDDIFMALGAGITNLQPEKEGDITTTIDQTHSPQPPAGWNEKERPLQTLEKHTGKKKKMLWIQHAGFAYAVIPQFTTGELRVGRELRTTNWQRLTKLNKGDEYEVPVFQMDINHGRNVKDAAYAYIVNYTGEIPREIPAVLSNTTKLQAAENAAGNQLGAVFYDTDAELKSSMGTFTISRPAVLFAEKTDGKLLLTITDAKMDVNADKIEVYTSIPVSGTNVSKIDKKTYKIEILMPAEPNRGAPKTELLMINDNY